MNCTVHYCCPATREGEGRRGREEGVGEEREGEVNGAVHYCCPATRDGEEGGGERGKKGWERGGRGEVKHAQGSTVGGY